MNTLFYRMGFITSLVITVIFLTTVSAFGDINGTIKKSFTVESHGQLTLETDLGSIGIKAIKGNTVDVEVIRRVRALSKEDAQEILEDFKIDFDQIGKDVHIIARFKKKGWWGFWDNIRHHLRIEFVITVPPVYNVELKTSGGSISVEDIVGVVNSKTSGGSLYFDKIKGPIWGKTSGGSIKVGKVEGNVDIDTSGGSIAVEELKGTIKARTSGGSVKAYVSSQPKSDCRLKTSGGSISVYLDEGIRMDVNASTSGGRIYTEFPVTIQGEINKRKLKAEINGGGPELYLHTSGGSIHIKKSTSPL